VEDDQCEYKFIVDREKAALNGITEETVARTMQAAEAGYPTGLLHIDTSKEDIPILVRLNRAERSSINDLLKLPVAGHNGQLIALSELVHVEQTIVDKSIYHKNLMPVTYVTGDVAGAMESPVYAIMAMRPRIAQIHIPDGYLIEQYMAHQPEDASVYSMKWDGEWQVTYEVFRDLGLAFAIVLVLIYALVVGWFQSFLTPFIIMIAIPFSLVGIVPGHALLHAFFTATSMIGFIAGSFAHDSAGRVLLSQAPQGAAIGGIGCRMTARHLLQKFASFLAEMRYESRTLSSVDRRRIRAGERRPGVLGQPGLAFVHSLCRAQFVSIGVH
jgi:multidrug efflux pump subunit AcrB